MALWRRSCNWASATVLQRAGALLMPQSMTVACGAPPFEHGNRVRKASASRDRSSRIWHSTLPALSDLQTAPESHIMVKLSEPCIDL